MIDLHISSDGQSNGDAAQSQYNLIDCFKWHREKY